MFEDFSKCSRMLEKYVSKMENIWGESEENPLFKFAFNPVLGFLSIWDIKHSICYQNKIMLFLDVHWLVTLENVANQKHVRKKSNCIALARGKNKKCNVINLNLKSWNVMKNVDKFWIRYLYVVFKNILPVKKHVKSILIFFSSSGKSWRRSFKETKRNWRRKIKARRGWKVWGQAWR